MTIRGEIVSVYPDITLDQVFIQIQTTKAVMPEIESVRGIDADIEIKKHREKRSLSSNAYFHVLVDKIRQALNISMAECKNNLISEYGQVQMLPDGEQMIYKTNAPEEYMKQLETIHTKCVKVTEENGKNVYFYRVYRGSSTYNSEEMAKLIQGTVDEAKELGIETLTPAEIKAMNERWKVEIGSD